MLEPKDQIKDKLDIAEVIGEYMQLKPAGSGSLKGLCPFHGEKTPSFHVSRERQMWHCFGCDKGGDMFAFVMEMDSLTFPEALRTLGKKAGVEIPEYHPTQATTKRDRLLAMHDLAAKWYTKFLREHVEAQAARDYLAKRAIGDDLVEKFRLGASADRWDSLVKFLATKGFSENEIVEGGLGTRRKSGNGLFDRFRNRVMVPLCDASGNVVGFTARVLPAPTTPSPFLRQAQDRLSERRGDDEGPKYMNSPETPIYHKGDMLYGLHLAKGGIRTRKEVIVVEGNLDVIASHKAGVENVVGSSGTALTTSQLKTLARYTKRIVFALDEDAAGFGAAQRVFELAIQMQNDDPTLRFDIRCLIIPPGAGKDPDEVVQKDPELWRKVAERSEDVVEYFFTKKIRDFEMSGTSAGIDMRTRLVDELLPRLKRIERPDQRHLYLLRIADATHVSLGLLEDMLNKAEVKSRENGTVRSVEKLPEDIRPLTTTRVDKAAAFLLGLALKHEAFAAEALSAVRVDMLSDAGLSRLYTELNIVYTRNETPVPSTQRNVFYSRLRAKLEGQGLARETSLLDALTLQTDELLAGLPPKEVRQEADRNIAILADADKQVRRKQLESSIREAELSGDATRLTELVSEYSAFLSGKLG